MFSVFSSITQLLKKDERYEYEVKHVKRFDFEILNLKLEHKSSSYDYKIREVRRKQKCCSAHDDRNVWSSNVCLLHDQSRTSSHDESANGYNNIGKASNHNTSGHNTSSHSTSGYNIIQWITGHDNSKSTCSHNNSKSTCSHNNSKSTCKLNKRTRRRLCSDDTSRKNEVIVRHHKNDELVDAFSGFDSQKIVREKTGLKVIIFNEGFSDTGYCDFINIFSEYKEEIIIRIELSLKFIYGHSAVGNSRFVDFYRVTKGIEEWKDLLVNLNEEVLTFLTSENIIESIGTILAILEQQIKRQKNKEVFLLTNRKLVFFDKNYKLCIHFFRELKEQIIKLQTNFSNNFNIFCQDFIFYFLSLDIIKNNFDVAEESNISKFDFCNMCLLIDILNLFHYISNDREFCCYDFCTLTKDAEIHHEDSLAIKIFEKTSSKRTFSDVQIMKIEDNKKNEYSCDSIVSFDKQSLLIIIIDKRQINFEVVNKLLFKYMTPSGPRVIDVLID